MKINSETGFSKKKTHWLALQHFPPKQGLFCVHTVLRFFVVFDVIVTLHNPRMAYGLPVTTK